MRRLYNWSVLAGISTFLAISGASASPFTVTTTGTINAGTDPANFFGAGAGLIGSNYTLRVAYTGLGPGYTSSRGLFAVDAGDLIPSSVTLTIGPTMFTAALLTSTGATLSETTSGLFASDGGTDAAGNFTSVFQNLTAAAGNTPIPVADLQTSFSYLLTPGDAGVDILRFSNAANTQTSTFSGIESSIALAVPEPASWAILGLGLFGIGFGRRRRTIRSITACALSGAAVTLAGPA